MNGDEDHKVQTFLCPECGSTKKCGEIFLNAEYDRKNPWSAVFHRIRCAQCNFWLPAHLAERWFGLSVVAARAEWQSAYRSTES